MDLSRDEGKGCSEARGPGGQGEQGGRAVITDTGCGLPLVDDGPFAHQGQHRQRLDWGGGGVFLLYRAP